MAAADDVECLQQRHAGFHHGRQLTSEEGDILFSDPATTLETDFLDLGMGNTLTADLGLYHGLAGGTHFAVDLFAILVPAFPKESCFLDSRGS
ncbi:MAG: hypothetical protein ACD_10C00002G0002 [uncultured bacterium]|nr:MAG: hypothetical protein ACD_10C00002G0002 [uncultured bacterium]